MSLHIGAAVAGNLAATLVVARVGARRLVCLSFLLLSGSLGLAALAPSLAVVFVAQFWLGLSQGIGYPVLMGLSIRCVAAASRTTAMGLHQAVYAIGMFSGFSARIKFSDRVASTSSNPSAPALSCPAARR